MRLDAERAKRKRKRYRILMRTVGSDSADELAAAIVAVQNEAKRLGADTDPRLRESLERLAHAAAQFLSPSNEIETEEDRGNRQTARVSRGPHDVDAPDAIPIVPKTGHETTALEVVLDELSFQKDSTQWTANVRDATRAAYKALRGFEPGEEWRGALAHEISVEVNLRAEERLRAAEDRRRQRFEMPLLPALPLDGPIALSGIRGRLHSLPPAEVLAIVQKRTRVPRWITSALVESLVARAGGRGGTTNAMDLIDQMATAHAKKIRKPRR